MKSFTRLFFFFFWPTDATRKRLQPSLENTIWKNIFLNKRIVQRECQSRKSMSNFVLLTRDMTKAKALTDLPTKIMSSIIRDGNPPNY